MISLPATVTSFASRAKYTSKQNQQFFAEVFAIFDRIAKGFARSEEYCLQAKTASNELKSKVKEFDALRSALKEEFAEIARKLSEELKSSGATAIKPDEFLKLRKAIENATQILNALTKEKEQQITLQKQLSAA